jgi:sugar phosphate isomerase/epimerase
MARIPIALELYSVRQELAADALGTLKAVAAMGYEGVEFAGPPQHEADELRKMLDETNLACCGWHTPFNLVQDEALDDTIAFNKTLDNPNVIVPGIPAELRKTRDDWLKLAERFNALAEKLAPHGMRTGYHNHNIEFAELDGEQPWDTFFGNTRAEVVMQLDMGNAASGGGDCAAILERYPGRAVTVHLKPYHAGKGAESPHAGFQPIIGEDTLPWEEIFRLCETTGGTQWYIVEYESDAYPPLESVERCLKALKAMGK